MAVPVSGRDIFVVNDIFAKSLCNVPDFYSPSFSQSSSTTHRFRGAAFDLVPLDFGSALSRHSSISLI